MRIARLMLAFGLFMVTIALMLVPDPEEPAPPPPEDWRAAFAAPLPRGEMRLLFVGNSFTARHDVPGQVAAMLEAGGVADRVRTREVAPGGSQLHDHARSEELRRDIAELNWTAVILQDVSTAPLFETDSARSAEAIGRLSRIAMEGGARSVLFSTWARAPGNALYRQSFEGYAEPRGPAEMTAVVSRHYETLSEELGAFLAPVGEAWQIAGEVLPHIALHANDGFHASPAGAYLSALVIARSLGLDPRAIDWAPEAVDPAEAGQLRMLVASIPE